MTGGQLSAGPHTVATGFILTDGAIYTVAIENVTDLAGNATPAVNSPNIIYDATAVVISNVTPVAGGVLNKAEAAYTLSETAQTGKITFTRTGGVPDSSAPYTYILNSADLGAGPHTIATSLLLVNGTVYTLSIEATDLAGNPATTVSVANVTFSDRHLLTVLRNGTGSGIVTAATGLNAGIYCGTQCTEMYWHGASVELTATADSGSTFRGWSDPACPASGACSVSMDGAKLVTATFDIEILDTFTITTAAGDYGSITPTATVNYGATATVTVTPNPGYLIATVLVDGFAQIINDPSKYKITFDTVAANHLVNATFATGSPLSVTMIGTGGGSVNSNPSGIHCTSGICQANFVNGKLVTLSSVPNGDSVIGAWSGACSGCSGASCQIAAGNNNNACSIVFTFVKPARIGAINYDSLQLAYDAAADGATIMARDHAFLGDLKCNLSKKVTIHGGYNQTYTSHTGSSFIKGVMTIGKGTVVTVDRITIR